MHFNIHIVSNLILNLYIEYHSVRAALQLSVCLSFIESECLTETFDLNDSENGLTEVTMSE